MHYLVKVLARNVRTGDIIDDGFVTQNPYYMASDGLLDGFLKKPDAERVARDFCQREGLEFLDYDGPFAAPLFPYRTPKRRPRWDSRLAPNGVDPTKWAARKPVRS